MTFSGIAALIAGALSVASFVWRLVSPHTANKRLGRLAKSRALVEGNPEAIEVLRRAERIQARRILVDTAYPFDWMTVGTLAVSTAAVAGFSVLASLYPAFHKFAVLADPPESLSGIALALWALAEIAVGGLLLSLFGIVLMFTRLRRRNRLRDSLPDERLPLEPEPAPDALPADTAEAHRSWLARLLRQSPSKP